MKYEIVDSSPQAVAKSQSKIELPMESLSVGKSFAVTDVAEGALRTYVSRQARKLGYKCKVIKHGHCYEVARIA